MNKADWSELGGRPRDIDDPFLFMAAGLDEAFKGIFSMCGQTQPEGVIISGCVVTTPAAATPGDANSADITEGFIYLAGEIYHVAAALTLTKGGTDAWVFKATDIDAGQPQAYLSGSVETLRIRKGVLVGEPTATAGNFMPYNADTYGIRTQGKLFTGTTAPIFATTGALSPVNIAFHRSFNPSTKVLTVNYSDNLTAQAGNTASLRFMLNLTSYDLGSYSVRGRQRFFCWADGAPCVLAGSNNATELTLTKLDGSDFATGTLGNIYINFNLYVN